MASEEPLLTIAIPTFNSAHFLPDAIASIMREGLDDFEILIVDNASEDNTEEVVRSFENHIFDTFGIPRIWDLAKTETAAWQIPGAAILSSSALTTCCLTECCESS